jgi:hypothetical protein
VRELEETMTMAELGEWLALLKIEPWGSYREDLLTAMICRAVIAPWSKKDTTLESFLPSWWRKEQKEISEETPEQAMAYLISLGAQVEAKPHGS